jgi:hypothetical protein
MHQFSCFKLFLLRRPLPPGSIKTYDYPLIEVSHSVAKPGVSKWGVKGRVREGCTPSRWGCGGCAPGKFFKLHMHAGEFKSNFHTKINTLTPVFMPLSFGKIFKLHMHAGEF